jgi:hypothetical protein
MDSPRPRLDGDSRRCWLRPGTGTWQHLALTFNGTTIRAAINGATLASVTDSGYLAGMVGFGADGYQTDQFDNLSVTPVSSTPSGYIVAGDDTPECVDANTGSSAPGTVVQTWDWWTCGPATGAPTSSGTSPREPGSSGRCPSDR